MADNLLNSNELKHLFRQGQTPSPSDFGHLIDTADAARGALGLKTLAPVTDGMTPGPDSGLIYKNGHLNLNVGTGLTFDAQGRLTFDSKTEQDIRDDQTKKLNLNELFTNNLAKLNAPGGKITWEGNTTHYGWSLWPNKKVDLLSRPNAGLPKLKAIDSAIRLTVNNKPGSIYTIRELKGGETYMFSWVDAVNMPHQESSGDEQDQYEVTIATYLNGEVHNTPELRSKFTCSFKWGCKGVVFIPPKDDKYYITFRGQARDDSQKDFGALVSFISGRKLS